MNFRPHANVIFFNLLNQVASILNIFIYLSPALFVNSILNNRFFLQIWSDGSSYMHFYIDRD